MNWKLFYIPLALLIIACSTKEKVTVNPDGDDLPFRKIVKSQDYKLKFRYAEKYFANEDYYRAQQLYEEVIPFTKTEDLGRTAYYRYAQCYYRQSNYYLAGYYFKQFFTNYNFDPRAEEALFKSALCKVSLSPQYSLDATETTKAIDQLQLFIDKYPQTSKRDTCNQLIDKLYNRLDKKKYEIAMLYYQTGNYKSAVVMYDVALREFPQSQYKESILFHRLKSYFLFAENSIEAKKNERYVDTIESYHKFASVFPDSKFMDEAESILRKAKKRLEEPIEK